MIDHYNTISKDGQAEFKDRGSTFVAFAFSVNTVEAFKIKLAEIKSLHPKATHHCFAYRMGVDGLIFRVSDDGEPSGTAGKPILGQIDSKQLTNVCIIVVRYFGGTLLGVGGLIQAYKTVSVLALQVTPAIRKLIEVSYRLQFPYPTLNDIMRVIKKHELKITSQELQLFCFITISVPIRVLDTVSNEFSQMNHVELKREV